MQSALLTFKLTIDKDALIFFEKSNTLIHSALAHKLMPPINRTEFWRPSQPTRRDDTMQQPFKEHNQLLIVKYHRKKKEYEINIDYYRYHNYLKKKKSMKV